MAQQIYKVDLSSAKLPMLPSLHTRTIIGSVAGEAPSVEDRPGVVYGHNVLPSARGFTSVGYRELVPNRFDVTNPSVFAAIFELYDTESNRLYWAIEDNGLSWYLTDSGWVDVDWSVAWLNFNYDPKWITIGKVNGVSYLFNGDPSSISELYRGVYKLAPSGEEDYEYDMVRVTTTGLDEDAVIGISSSNGYLLAYTTQAVAWSSTLDPSDFVPSLVTGAGGGRISELSGAITSVQPHPAGFIIYTEDNMVMATITGNPRYPFRFKEIPDSKGCASAEVIAYEANSTEQFAYTNAGLVAVSPNRAEVILPEITDFLSGELLETYLGLGEFSRSYLTSSLHKRLTYIGGRYLVISYGIRTALEDGRVPIYTHALVVDTVLKRLGKLQREHIDVIEYTAEQQEIGKHSIALLGLKGKLEVVDVSGRTEADDSVLLLGKFQFVRTHGVTLHSIEVETTPNPYHTDFTCVALTSLSGKLTDFISNATMARGDATNRTYNCRATGKSHTVELTGTFNLVTVQVSYSNAGRR